MAEQQRGKKMNGNGHRGPDPDAKQQASSKMNGKKMATEVSDGKQQQNRRGKWPLTFGPRREAAGKSENEGGNSGMASHRGESEIPEERTQMRLPSDCLKQQQNEGAKGGNEN